MKVHQFYKSKKSENNFSSQFGQDAALFDQFSDFQQGFFVDIGAHDGVSFSNSLFFERCLSWDGICFEPNPVLFSKCKTNRKCLSENACVSSRSGEVFFVLLPEPLECLGGIEEFFSDAHAQRINDALGQFGGSAVRIQVKSIVLTDYLVSKEIKEVDLLLVDVEGAEMEILKSIDYSRINIKSICVENNYHGDEIVGFLYSKGYNLQLRLGCDEIYKKKLEANK